MFLIRNKKINLYHCKYQFCYIKVSLKGVNIIWACFRDVSILVPLFPIFFLSSWNTMVFSITTCPFTRHGFPYVLHVAVNKMPSFCAMTKECDLFSFELHSNMSNIHWNNDVINQGSVISPRTGVLHASVTKTAKSDHPCIGRIRIFVPYSLKGLPFWSDYMGE